MARPYELPDTALPVNENFQVIVDDSTLTTPQKITIADLTAPAEARIGADVAAVMTGTGLDAGTGVYTPEETSNYLNTKSFINAGLVASLFTADMLLDSKIKDIVDVNGKYYSITLTSSQIKNLLATKVLILPTPGAGYINHVKRMFYKLNFTTTAYTLPGAGEFQMSYNSGSSSIGSISSTYLSSAAQPQPMVVTVDDVELYANEAIYLQSTFGGELTLGDSTLSLILEYETIADFAIISTPPVQQNCLQSYQGTFTNATLTALGNLEINHNLNTDDILSLVIVDDKNTQVTSIFNLGTEAGANTLNVITVPIGLGITGTWTYALIVNIC
mgnify:FL=1